MPPTPKEWALGQVCPLGKCSLQSELCGNNAQASVALHMPPQPPKPGLNPSWAHPAGFPSVSASSACLTHLGPAFSIILILPIFSPLCSRAPFEPWDLYSALSSGLSCCCLCQKCSPFGPPTSIYPVSSPSSCLREACPDTSDPQRAHTTLNPTAVSPCILLLQILTVLLIPRFVLVFPDLCLFPLVPPGPNTESGTQQKINTYLLK